MITKLSAAAGAVALSLLKSVAVTAAPAVPFDPTGIWQIQDGTARVRIEKCGPQDTFICGYTVWLQRPLDDLGVPRVDVENPDPRRRWRPVLGHQNILGMRPNGEGKYEGTIYNVENGRVYGVTVALTAPGSSELIIHACMLGIWCENLVWTRTMDVLQGQLAGPTNGSDGPASDAEWRHQAVDLATSDAESGLKPEGKRR